MNLQKISSPKDSELNNNCKRAIKTTMIGAIAKFEENFGFLWGVGKSEPTENEKKFLELWLKTRNQVLDCGNAQSRIIEKEFGKYKVKYNNYQYKFKVVNRRENGNV